MEFLGAFLRINNIMEPRLLSSLVDSHVSYIISNALQLNKR